MAFTHSIVRTYQEGGRSVTNTVNVSGNAESAFTISAAVASPDTEVLCAINYTDLKSLYIESDLDLDVETNSGSVPDDTISVKAGVAYVWTSEDGSTNPLTADVTKLFLTAAGSGTATVNIRILQDATP